MLTNLLRRGARLPGFRRVLKKLPSTTFAERVAYDLTERPHYTYGVYSAARLAARLKLPAISVVEFGVAGGRGLLALEAVAQEVGMQMGVEIEVVGFDSGEGMPEPLDYRDAPHGWQTGYYKMDVDALRAKLKPTTKLMLGDVRDTSIDWAARAEKPLGFVAFDLDYYSSTMAAFQVFDAPSHLPRVFCYFDDVFSDIICHNEYIGELCAMREFNLAHERKKICPLHGLRNMRAIPSAWNDQIYVMHDFEHPLYCQHISKDARLALSL